MEPEEGDAIDGGPSMGEASSMGLTAHSSAQEFRRLRDLGLAQVNAGHLKRALALFEEALVWARREGDPDLVDLALCNCSAVRISLGRGKEDIPVLRQILIRGRNVANCRLAAYHISRSYEYMKSHKKGLFYARIARDRSRDIGRVDWLAHSHNQIGNHLLALSFHRQAVDEYETALDLMPNTLNVWRARVLDNLGYCRILEGRYRSGFTLLYQSLRALQRLGVRRYQISTHLDLCYAYLETGRYPSARRHGEKALTLAREVDDAESIKNALYLLGQTAALDNDTAGAWSYFQRLERGYYPKSRGVAEFLLAVDVRQLVNLKA